MPTPTKNKEIDYKTWVNTAVRPESEEKVQAMFSSVAKRYDIANTLISFGMHYPWKYRTIEVAGTKEGSNVLDVCAGTCDLGILHAKKAGSTGKVTAFDFNKAMLDVGRYKVEKHGLLDRFEFVQGNAEDIKLPDNTYDIVTIGVASRHLDAKKAFAEIYRVLKPGGKFVCLDFFEPPNPVFAKLYAFYSMRILPWIGTFITRDKTGVYYYLRKSIDLFFSPEQYAEIIEGVGFKDVKFERMSGGIVCIHSGVK